MHCDLKLHVGMLLVEASQIVFAPLQDNRSGLELYTYMYL